MIRFAYSLCFILTLTSSTRASEQQQLPDPERAAALEKIRQGREETKPITIPGRSAEDVKHASKPRQEQPKSASWENVLPSLWRQNPLRYSR